MNYLLELNTQLVSTGQNENIFLVSRTLGIAPGLQNELANLDEKNFLHKVETTESQNNGIGDK